MINYLQLLVAIGSLVHSNLFVIGSLVHSNLFAIPTVHSNLF